MESPLTLKCPRCAHIWEYNGKNEFVASCSSCKTSVYLKKNMILADSPKVDGPVGSQPKPKSQVCIATEFHNHTHHCNSIFGMSES